jgi:drug/metabolite transporter (DMT)-like permease
MASVGRRIGSQNTNLLRAALAAVTLAAVVLPLYALVHGGLTLPTLAQASWLIASGTVGMVIGDACFYEALVLLGARRAVKINTLAPVVGVLVGWVALGERLGPGALAGALLVIAAVAYAAFANTARPGETTTEPGGMSAVGLLCGLISAACIGLGSVLGRQAYKVAAVRPLDPIVATTLRVGCAAALLFAIAVVRRRVPAACRAMKDPAVRTRIAYGTLLGPLLGMISFVSALKFAPAGLVSTVISTSPLVILPIVAVKYRIRVSPALVAACLLAVVGVAMISWN